MAPVPKEKRPEDPFKFPVLDSPRWQKRTSGLKVWELKVGEGNEVKDGSRVTVHYIGWLADGKMFESSRKESSNRATGIPATLGLAQVIKGFREGMIGMKPGGVRRFFIPPDLAYGESGAGPTVPANATLVFAVELVR